MQQIANTSRIMHREKGGYVVPSQTGSGAYLVTYENFKPVCECKDFELKCILELVNSIGANIESTNNMVKAKFGDYVRSKTWTAQINEVLLKILCHNIYVVIQEMHELGIEPNFVLKN